MHTIINTTTNAAAITQIGSYHTKAISRQRALPGSRGVVEARAGPVAVSCPLTAVEANAKSWRNFSLVKLR